MGLSYRPEIDGLRAMAVVPVVLYHADVPGFGSGYLGVDIFFVISGYLITRILIGESPPTLLGFYERRLRRIAPALLVVMLATAVIGFAILTPVRLQELAASILFAPVANFWFMTQSVYMGPTAADTPLIHLWSLAVEEQFYLLFPLVLWGTSRMGRRWQLGILAGIAAISIGLSTILAQWDANQAFFRSDTRAWELLLGAVCAVAPAPRLLRSISNSLAVAGLLLIMVSYFLLPGPVAPTLLSLPVCVGAGLILIFGGTPSLPMRLLGSAPLVGLGLISYSLYLWHQPLLAFARIQNLGTLTVAQSALAIALAVLLSVLTWRFVEQPARDRAKCATPQVVWQSAAAAAVLVIFGVSSLGTAGMAFRYGDNAAAYFASVGVVDDTSDARGRAIRMGVCHYREDRVELSKFLGAWREQCSGSEGGRGVLVVGDSHAADIAAGFLLNGMNVGQATAAGCGLAPALMYPECRSIFDMVVSGGPSAFNSILLVYNQTSANYSDSDIADAVDYWGQLGLPMTWLSDMPNYPGIEEVKAQRVLDRGTALIGEYPVTLAVSRGNYDRLSRLADRRYGVLDAATVFCSLTSQDTCLPYRTDDGFMAMSLGHLSAVGAQLFVERLMAAYPQIGGGTTF
ncbi:acyltransferase family protein [Devosia sp.]|uniref:acyltransferase family protein n=1 Tax=Devosia sp. TaxID=1871048 RepID=UPI0025C3ACE5|nr:acyltransferase family protein [Devosia sp.]